MNLHERNKRAAVALAARRRGGPLPAPRVGAGTSPIEPAAVVLEFSLSHEYHWLAGGRGHPEWAEELATQMAALGWGWGELDLRSLWWILFDADPPPARWPRNARAVARELHALLAFAGRVYGAPRVDECCAYLASERAVRDIARWLRRGGGPKVSRAR